MDCQHLAERLRHYASDAGDYTAVAPRMNRIVELVDQEVDLVGQARQPPTATGQDDPRPDAQAAYVHLLNAIADEETPLEQACR